MAKSRRKRITSNPRKMCKRQISRTAAERKAVKSPYEKEKNAPGEEERRYGDRILKMVPQWRVSRLPREKLTKFRATNKIQRQFIVSDVLIHVLRRQRELQHTPPTAPEYRELIAIMHGVDFSLASVKRLFPAKKGIVCAWRESRIAKISTRSRQECAWKDADRARTAKMYATVAWMVGLEAGESDSE